MIKKSTLAKKLSSYSVLASFLLVESAKSQILYTKLATPDTIIGGGKYGQGQYYLDLDNDGVNDFEILDNFKNGNRYASIIHVSNGSASAAVDDSYFGVNQNNKSKVIYSIEPAERGWGGGGRFSGVSYFSTKSYSIHWTSDDLHYAALRIKKSDGFHYGWLRISALPTDTNKGKIIKLVVYDYVYEERPYNAVVTGDTGFFNYSMPVPDLTSIHAIDCKNYASVKVTNVPVNSTLTWYKLNGYYQFFNVTRLTDSTYSFTQQQNGFYRVVVSDGQNVTITDTFNINILPPGAAAQPFIQQLGDLLISTPAKSYQWFYNNFLLPLDTSQSMAVQSNGQYKVMITDSNGCKNISGEAEFTAQDHVFLIGRQLYVQVVSLDFIGGTLNILTESGQSVRRQNISSHFFTVSLDELEKGIYFLQLSGNGNQLVTKILVY